MQLILLTALAVISLIALWGMARYFSRRRRAKAPVTETFKDAALSSTAEQPAPQTDQISADRYVLELEAKLRTRDSVIGRLMGAADQSDELLEECEQTIRKQAAAAAGSQQQISALNRQLGHINTLQLTMAGRERRIGQLNNRLDHLKALAQVSVDQLDQLRPQAARLAQVDAALTTKEQAIRQLEAAANAAARSADQWQTKLADKDERIAQLNQATLRIPALETALQDKEGSIKSLQASIESLQGDIEHNKKAGNEQSAELERQAQAAASLKQELSQQSDHVAGLEAEIRDKDQELEQLQANLMQANQEDQGTRLDELESTLKNREQALQALQTQLTALTDEHAAIHAALKERESTIAGQTSELSRLAAIEAASVERDKELAELREASAQAQANQAKAANIRKALNKAEQVAIAAEQGAMEAQRLREQLKTLGKDRVSATRAKGKLEHQIVEEAEQATPEEAEALRAHIQELESLDADIQDRDKKMADLKKRLTTLSRKKAAAKPRKKAKPAITEPLYEAPGERDDLKKIRGIGPVLEKTLNQLGVTTYRQVASFEDDDINKVTQALGIIPNRIERDDWIGGARKAMANANNGQSLRG